MRIAMYAASLRHWGKLYPNALTEDVPSPAGTEIAMMGVSRGLAAKGHQVRVFANCDPGVYDGVEYMSADLALPVLTTVPHDVVVSWQDATIFMYPVKADLKVLMSQSAHLNLGQAANHVDRYFAISRFSAKTLLTNDPYARPENMWVTRNGVILDRFAGMQHNDRRNHHRIIWASSPDRGLHHLADAFPRIREVVPDAELYVCYNFDSTMEAFKEHQSGSAYVRWLEEAAKLKGMPGVKVLNHVTQPKLADILLSAGVFAYPCDPLAPTETYCIAVNEAMAAGLPVVISDADCLPENYGKFAATVTRPIDQKTFVRFITNLMTVEDEWDYLHKKSLALASLTDFSSVAEDWEAFFTDYPNDTTMDRSLASKVENHELVSSSTQ